MHTSRHNTVAVAVALALGTGIADAPRSLAADAMIEEILVTARKREESLKDISAAISVVGKDALQKNVINDVRDLQNLVPQLSIGEIVGIMKITMRGLGNSTNTRGEDSEVAFHVDGAVVSRQETQAMALFDLERIEVLRGPQGTLYGRNSTGGTVNVITAKPTEEFEGYVNLTGGNYDFVRVDSAVSGPLSDGIRGRLAMQSINRSGFGENITTGNDIDDDKRWAARGHLLFNLSDDVGLLLSGDYAKGDDASGLFTYYTPLYVIGDPAPPSQDPKGVGGFSDPDSRDGAGNIDPELERETWSVTGTLNWDINDSLSLKNIINYRELDFYLAQDLDLSTVVPPPNTTATVSIPMDDEQFSEELQLTYTTDKLSLIGGLYYFTEQLQGTTYVGETESTGIWFWRAGESDAESWATFFNANYRWNDLVTLRVGGRFNHDERDIDSWQWVLGNITVPPNSPTNPGNDSRSDSKYVGEYGIDFHLTDNSMIYYTFAQGYRQGAGIIMQTNNPIIDPTEVDSHEVGYKIQTSDGSIALNLAAFYATIENLQRTQAVPLPNGTFQTIINNIDELETAGVEADLKWAPTDNFVLSAAVSYLDAEYKDYLTDDPLRFGTLLEQVAGNVPNLSPDWKGNLNAEYVIPLGNGGEVTLGANATYVGEQFFDEFNRDPFAEDAYTLFDANVTYAPEEQNWSVSLWGKNLSDEDMLLDTSFSANGRVTSKHFINPRTYGVSANLRF
jgi:iron complex outermembrane receptor protein